MQSFYARAPVRVDPAGGGTDAPPFSVDYGGMVVNFAVQRHAFARVDRLPKGSDISIRSEDLNERVSAPTLNELPNDKLGLLQGFVRRLLPDGEAIALTTQSDAPPGAGLGGSGALGVAVVAALDTAFGTQRTPEETAQVANDVERIDLGFPGGNQDSLGAALGGFNRLEYVKGGGTISHRIHVPESTRLEIEHSSLLIYTSEAHVSGNIHQDIKDSYAMENSPTVRAMENLREAATEMASALEKGDIATYADCMNRSCDNLYKLHPSCDCDAHRKYQNELSDCILSRKTCGAGGGGFLLIHTQPGKRKECIQRAEKLGALVWPVTIDPHGVQTWIQETA